MDHEDNFSKKYGTLDYINGTCRITRLKEQFTISVNMIIIYSYIKIT